MWPIPANHLDTVLAEVCGMFRGRYAPTLNPPLSFASKCVRPVWTTTWVSSQDISWLNMIMSSIHAMTKMAKTWSWGTSRTNQHSMTASLNWTPQILIYGFLSVKTMHILSGNTAFQKRLCAVIYFLNLKKSQASQDLITIYDHIDGLAPLHFINTS